MAKDQPDGKKPAVPDRHGDKTHAAFLENLHHKQLGEDERRDMQAKSNQSRDADEFGRDKPGHHRLQEGREQHDEAEKDSEYNRLSR